MGDLFSILDKLQESMSDSISVNDYVKKQQVRQNISKPFSQKDMALIFLDIESTGTDLENDRIIQLAFIKEKENKVEYYNDLCYTDVRINYSAMGVHHITPEMIENECYPKDTQSFKKLEDENIPTNYFITHNNTLDIAMLENEEIELLMKCIDTDKCARHLLKDAENYKLQTLRYQYGLYKSEKELLHKLGIDEIQAHDALGDALLHYLLFKFLLKKVDGDINKLVTLTHTSVLLEKITFGKYKEQDMTFEELFNLDPMDFVWMYSQPMALRWSELNDTLEYWLEKRPKYLKMAKEKRNLL